VGKGYTHISQIFNFFGLDLRSSELVRPRGFLSDGSQDWMHTPQGAHTTRYGSKLISSGYGKVGLTRFDTTSMLGVSKSEIIGFGATSLNDSTYPWRLVRSSFTLTNSHATVAATVTHYYDEATSQFRFGIVRGTTLIDQALGVGTEGSPYMLSSLETAVDALTSFAMSTPTNASTTPAAFMELLAGQTVAAAGGTLTVYYYYWEQVSSVMLNTGIYASLKNPMYEIGSEQQRNVSTAAVRSVLYMSSGTNNTTAVAGGSPLAGAVLTKYDGQDFYRAGFRGNAGDGSILSATDLANPQNGVTDSKGTRDVATGLTGTYTYRIHLVRIDKAGNRIESNLLPDTSGAGANRTPSNEVMRINIYNVTATSTNTGYGVRTAKVNGAQASVTTITVDSGHTITAGCIIYFYDDAQGRFIQREVTSVTATTIVISTVSLDPNPASPNYDIGSSVTLLDNAAISNNVRVAIFRTAAGGTSLFLVSERPMHSYDTVAGANSGQIEYDDVTDTNLGAEYVEPAYPRDPPPIGSRYLCSFNDQLIISGNDKSPNTVYFSDEGPEYFPADSHSFDLEDRCTGVHQTGEVLACGTKNTLSIVAGDLINFAFRVSKIGNNIGVTSHFSMREAMEGVMMFSSYKGPYVLRGGRDLSPLGMIEAGPGVFASRLEPYWTQVYGPSDVKPVFERAIAAVLPNDSVYVLFVPTEDPALPTFATSASVTFVYNYARDSWYKWTGLNMAGGMAVLDDQLLFGSRAYDGAGSGTYSDVTSYMSQQQKRKGKYNFADHGTAITLRLKSYWEALGRHAFFKRFLRIKIYSDETRVASPTSLTLKTYVDRDTSKLSTTDTLSWTDQKEMTAKIKSETCRSMQVVFENSAFYQAPVISGYELEAVGDFRPEFKE
jgi:hypothetical protein